MARGRSGMGGIADALRRRRAAVSIGFDSGAWVLSYAAFTWLRLDTDADAVPWTSTILLALATVAIYVVLGGQVKLHQGRARLASLEEMLLLGVTVGLAGSTIFAVNLIGHWIPRSVPAG